ncbi:MAG: type II toxin-antitoxin system VapC family toxin [Bryobacteraceae bacterium]
MFLLDTHALVWGISEPDRLPATVREILVREEVHASVVSYWELMLKKGRQSALVIQPLDWWQRYVTRQSISVIPVRVEHVNLLDEMPEWHRDPFDRMLVAQAMAESLTLITKDDSLGRYGVPVVWG